MVLARSTSLESMSGNKLARDTEITNDLSSSGNPSIVWTGSEYGIAFSRDGHVYFIRPSSSAERPSLVWNGDEYAVAWRDVRDGNREMYFRRIDAAGQPVGSTVRVTNDDATSEHPSLAWDGV